MFVKQPLEKSLGLQTRQVDPPLANSKPLQNLLLCNPHLLLDCLRNQLLHTRILLDVRWSQ